MTSYKDLPDTLKPYHFQGVSFSYAPKDKNVMAECLFCSKERFSIDVNTGKYKCWVCGLKGNATTFVRELHTMLFKETEESHLEEYTKSIKLCTPRIPKLWGISWNHFTKRWVVPGYGTNLQIATLYSYNPFKDKDKTKYRWMPTPTLGMRLFGLNLFDTNKPLTYICEGIHDSMALYEVLSHGRISQETLQYTKDPETSLIQECNVIGIPGCESWQASWNKLVEGKEVRLMFDNDWPILQKGNKETLGGGIKGTMRTAGILYHNDHVASSVEALVWGDDGHTKEFPNGYDVRDYLSS